MPHAIYNALTFFLQKHYDHASPLLLAFSGGPDSQALLRALQNYDKKHKINFAVAHVDHRWRTESAKEASEIKERMAHLGIAYHEKVLDPNSLTGNLEQACREERYQFFSELAKKFGYTAVLTAHHRDDVAETVLKKIFEGKSIPFLSGIQDVIKLNGITVWRPLIEVSKKEIFDYIQKNNIKSYTDSTNSDPKFLRARMRIKLIPYLTETFGKEIGPGLCHIAHEATEIYDLLESKTKAIFDEKIEGPFGVLWDLSSCDLHMYEVKFLLKKICNFLSIVVSRDVVDLGAELIMQKKANKCLDNFLIDRGYIFYLTKDIQCVNDTIVGPNTKVICGPWLVEMSDAKITEKNCSWKDFWKGSGQIAVPKGEYLLRLATSKDHFPKTHSISKWWTDNKVPFFFRKIIPVLFQSERVVYELLTGRAHTQETNLVTLNFSIPK